MLTEREGVITIDTSVPIFRHTYGDSDDPLVRILCKLKKEFANKRGLSVTHLVNRPRHEGGYSDTEEITIQFMVSNFGNNMSKEHIKDVRSEYAKAAITVLNNYLAGLEKIEITEESPVNELIALEDKVINEVKKAVAATPELATQRLLANPEGIIKNRFLFL